MFTQLILPVAIFTSIVLALSAFVLLARRQLEPRGTVTIDVNGQRTVVTEAGRRLLWALADNGVHLPAACGGRGTCGQCRVVVTSGGGAPMPTEAVHIDASDQARGVRLACALRLRDDVQIVVPESVLDVRQWSCELIASRNVATFVKEIVLAVPESETLRFDAGAYVVVEAPPHRIEFRDFDIADEYTDEWRQSGLLELESTVTTPVLRAYSLANPPQQSDSLVLLVRLAAPPANAPPGSPPGQVSSYLFGLKPGDRVTVAGPYGDFRARDSDCEMVFIAGGVGIAPIRSIILDQLARGTRRRMSLWYGARDKRDLCYIDELEDAARANEHFDLHIALSAPRESDEWTGHVGFIHRTVHDCYLSAHPTPRNLEYYLCGPPVMSAAVIEMLEQLGVDRSQVIFDDFGG